MSIEYGWMTKDADVAYGPFGSKEAALTDARRELLEQGCEPGARVSLIIGICKYPDPAKYLRPDLDDLLEDMDENAQEDGFGGDDPTFIALDGAEAALTECLRAWATQWVKAVCWILDESREA